ncbi:MAG: hypothetical protein KC583_08700, partial [Myxococcales bacterium]|nr:hypothetical protein [Myxococcales bacterium]
PTPIAGPPLAADFVTDLGGAFFLINVALALDLYADFTAPARASLPLSIWTFIQRVAGGLLAPPSAAHANRADDPLWRFLAEMAADDPPGPAPAEWRVPARWLAAFPEPATWGLAAAFAPTSQSRRPNAGRGPGAATDAPGGSTGRIQLHHPAGFLLADVPAHADPLRDLDPPTPLGPAAPRATHADPWQRWFDDWLLPYLRPRLQRGLGLSDGDRIGPVLLAQRATVQLGPERLDVHFRLETAAIEVRLAGLDRDPGFVPAAGRAISFHFH